MLRNLYSVYQAYPCLELYFFPKIKCLMLYTFSGCQTQTERSSLLCFDGSLLTRKQFAYNGNDPVKLKIVIRHDICQFYYVLNQLNYQHVYS